MKKKERKLPLLVEKEKKKKTNHMIVKNTNGLQGNGADIIFLITYVSTLTTTTYNVKSNVSLRMHDGKGQDGKYP